MAIDTAFILVVLIIFIMEIILFVFKKPCGCKENYRDPIYLNSLKYTSDYYPRSNGSIYGFPYEYGENWSIFSGWPYYPKAY